MSPNLEMLLRILVDERRTLHSKTFDARGQRHGADHTGTSSFGCLHDALRRLVQHAVIISLETDTNLVFSHRFPQVCSAAHRQYRHLPVQTVGGQTLCMSDLRLLALPVNPKSR